MPGAEGFAPSAARGRALDAAVRARLARSLSSLAEAAEGLLPVDPAALGALAAAVAAHPVRPAVMALYTEAMSALGERHAARLDAALRALADPALREAAAPRVVTLRDEDLGPGGAALQARLLDDDPSVRLDLAPVGDEVMATAPARLAAALDLLGPDFAGEIRAVTPEVLLVRPAPGTTIRFDGATSFYLWGCFALNLEAHATPVSLAEALAHESGHAVLFGLTMGGPMVENPAEERHASPLRDDTRPLEGIAHAAWVLARMHLACEAMLAQGALDGSARAEAGAARARIARDYAGALRTLAAHARFTEAGAAAFAPAEAYMAARGVARG